MLLESRMGEGSRAEGEEREEGLTTGLSSRLHQGDLDLWIAVTPVSWNGAGDLMQAHPTTSVTFNTHPPRSPPGLS